MSFIDEGNATLTTLTTPTITADGDRTFSGAGTTLNIRCLLQEVRMSQAAALGAVIAGAAGVLYVMKDFLGVTRPARGERMNVTLDGGAPAASYEIMHVIDREKEGGLAHFECFLKGL